MDQHRWRSVQQIFDRAVDLPEEERRDAAEAMCAGDELLLADVLGMLEEDARANPLLDADLSDTARAVLEFGSLPSLVERQIGPYRLLQLLGEGGTGVVYLAERTDIGGKVAIKLLRDAWFSPMRRQRFRIEQLTLAQLNHPAIARIYDSSTLEDGTPWFVMEYAEGLPLTSYWSRSRGTVRDALRLMLRVCEAVQYAHSHAIIHRDLKPSNILVSTVGEVKLLDFGIAKQLNGEDADRTLTGLRMMTLAYAAPEQLAGGAVGVYSDVYALGVLLHELLTGHLPHRELLPGLSAGAAQEPEKPSTLLRREKPAGQNQQTGRKHFAELTRAEWIDLDTLVLKALEVDPARRYRTVDALMRDANALLQGHPLEARRQTWTYTIGKFIRRNRSLIAGIAAMFLLVTATVAFYTVRLERARNAALREAARTLRMQQFTQSLFDGGDSAAGPAQDLKAVQLLDRGRQQAAGLGADPEMQADMQDTLGGIYQKLGKLDRAEPLLLSALEERRKLSGGQSRKVADSLVALARLRKAQGKLEDAETLARQAVEMERRLQPVSTPDIAAAMVALGEVLETRAKYDPARQILEEALKLQPQGKDATARTSENLCELANVAFYQGQYDVAEKLNNQALAIDERLLGNRNPAVAQELNNLGAIAMNRGDYATSEGFYRRSLAITEAWYGTDHPETAANLTALAQPLTFAQKEPEAQRLLERALAIQERVNGPVNATVATTRNQLGILAFRRKDYTAARSDFTAARDTWKRLFGEDYPSVAVAYSNLGSVCLEEKDNPCAETMYREAVRRLDATSANSLNDAVAHSKLGRTLFREGRLAEAEREALVGYTYLAKHVTAGDRFLALARKDLAAIYEAMHRTEDAARYRAELEMAAKQ